MSLLGQNDVTTSFSRDIDVIITPRVPWDTVPSLIHVIHKIVKARRGNPGEETGTGHLSSRLVQRSHDAVMHRKHCMFSNPCFTIEAINRVYTLVSIASYERQNRFLQCTNRGFCPRSQSASVAKCGSRVTIHNRIWWLCLVPISTTRFASDLGYKIAK